MEEQTSPGSLVLSPQMLGTLIGLVTPLIVVTIYVVSLSGKVDNLSTRLGAVEQKLELMSDQTEQQVRRIDRNVSYLCNERRRDNQEAGRPAADCQ